MLNLAAIKDRGLNPTFDDILTGMAAALGAQGDEAAEEREAIRAIEEACRKRQAVKSKRWATGWSNHRTIGPGWFIEYDKTVESLPPRNPSP